MLLPELPWIARRYHRTSCAAWTARQVRMNFSGARKSRNGADKARMFRELSRIDSSPLQSAPCNAALRSILASQYCESARTAISFVVPFFAGDFSASRQTSRIGARPEKNSPIPTMSSRNAPFAILGFFRLASALVSKTGFPFGRRNEASNPAGVAPLTMFNSFSKENDPLNSRQRLAQPFQFRTRRLRFGGKSDWFRQCLISRR